MVPCCGATVLMIERYGAIIMVIWHHGIMLWCYNIDDRMLRCCIDDDSAVRNAVLLFITTGNPVRACVKWLNRSLHQWRTASMILTARLKSTYVFLLIVCHRTSLLMLFCVSVNLLILCTELSWLSYVHCCDTVACATMLVHLIILDCFIGVQLRHSLSCGNDRNICVCF